MGTHPIFESDFDCLTDQTDLTLQWPLVQLFPSTVLMARPLVPRATCPPSSRRPSAPMSSPRCTPASTRTTVSPMPSRSRRSLLHLDRLGLQRLGPGLLIRQQEGFLHAPPHHGQCRSPTHSPGR